MEHFRKRTHSNSAAKKAQASVSHRYADRAGQYLVQDGISKPEHRIADPREDVHERTRRLYRSVPAENAPLRALSYCLNPFLLVAERTLLDRLSSTIAGVLVFLSASCGSAYFVIAVCRHFLVADTPLSPPAKAIAIVVFLWSAQSVVSVALLVRVGWDIGEQQRRANGERKKADGVDTYAAAPAPIGEELAKEPQQGTENGESAGMKVEESSKKLRKNLFKTLALTFLNVLCFCVQLASGVFALPAAFVTGRYFNATVNETSFFAPNVYIGAPCWETWLGASLALFALTANCAASYVANVYVKEVLSAIEAFRAVHLSETASGLRRAYDDDRRGLRSDIYIKWYVGYKKVCHLAKAVNNILEPTFGLSAVSDRLRWIVGAKMMSSKVSPSVASASTQNQERKMDESAMAEESPDDFARPIGLFTTVVTLASMINMLSIFLCFFLVLEVAVMPRGYDFRGRLEPLLMAYGSIAVNQLIYARWLPKAIQINRSIGKIAESYSTWLLDLSESSHEAVKSNHALASFVMQRMNANRTGRITCCGDVVLETRTLLNWLCFLAHAIFLVILGNRHV